jgi:hypothetical protein
MQRAGHSSRRFHHAAAAAALFAFGCGGSEDPRPAAWHYIAPVILAPNCATASCHSRNTAAAGLDFSDPDRGYTSLTGLWVWIVDPAGTPEANCRPQDGTVVCQRPLRPMVTPFVPAQSRLVHVLRGIGTRRMPPDRPLPEADIALVERWIARGARKHEMDFDGGVDAGEVGP